MEMCRVSGRVPEGLMPITTVDEAERVLDLAQRSGSSYAVEYWRGYRDALAGLHAGTVFPAVASTPVPAATPGSDSVTDSQFP